MLRRYLLTALLLGGLFGCLPVSQIPPRPPEGPDPAEPLGLDVPNITGEWVVENADRSIRQVWTLEMVGNRVTGEYTTAPDALAPGVTEPARPVEGWVIGSGNTWGVRLDTPTGGLIAIQSRDRFTFCPKPRDPDCRVAVRKGASPAPVPSGDASGNPSARPSWIIIHQ